MCEVECVIKGAVFAIPIFVFLVFFLASAAMIFKKYDKKKLEGDDDARSG